MAADYGFAVESSKDYGKIVIVLPVGLVCVSPRSLRSQRPFHSLEECRLFMALRISGA